MNKYIKSRIVSVLLMVMMFAGCIAPMQLGVYAEENGTQNVQEDAQSGEQNGEQGEDSNVVDPPVVEYTVTFYDTIGQNVIKEETVAEGSSATAPDAPVYDDLKFSGWDSEEYKNVTDNITVNTIYAERPQTPGNLRATGGYEKVYLSWDSVDRVKSDCPIYYQVRDEWNVPIVSVSSTNWTGKFDPYPGARNGKGTNATAKTAKYTVYAYYWDPVDKKPVYSKVGNTLRNIQVVHPMYVVVKAKRNAKMYASSSSTKSVGRATKGSCYIAIGGSRVSGKKKRVVIKVGGALRYISSSDVKIQKMVYNSKTRYTTAQIEAFIKDRGLTSYPKSGPKRLIWVNTYNQRVYLFSWTSGRWTVDKRYPNGILCNTGLELTPYGRFWVSSKWEKKKSTGTRWWTIFNSVGIHQKLSNALGKPASGGCVRIPTADAKWFYYNIKKSTTVFVY